jgi:RND family efflux transporter MFP subunit
MRSRNAAYCNETKPAFRGSTGDFMSLWKQALVTLALLAGAIVLSAVVLPATHPMLDRIGLLQPLARLGLVAEGAEPDGAGGQGGGRPAGGALVVAHQVRSEVLKDTVTAIGTARGARSVVLASEVAGRITAITVASGDFVQAGETIIELDNEAARIAVDRAALLVRDALATRDRVARLQATGASTDLQAQEAELALQTAELQLREAEFDLSRHVITAPITGWVGILTAEVGNQVAVNEEITRIEDRSSLLVDFRVPERVVRLLAVGDPVRAAPLAETASVLEGRISALDNRVDEASRTLQIQAAIDNDDDAMRPGMAFLISLDFTGTEHPSVDPLAIQWGADGSFVWIVRDGAAERVPVRILQRNSDVVLIDADIQPGDLVVSEGVQTLRPGGAVTLVEPGADTTQPKT